MATIVLDNAQLKTVTDLLTATIRQEASTLQTFIAEDGIEHERTQVYLRSVRKLMSALEAINPSALAELSEISMVIG